MSVILNISRRTITAGLACLVSATLGSTAFISTAQASTAGADKSAWPISFTKIKVSSGYGVRSNEPVRDCQPVVFDPKNTAYHPVSSHAPGTSESASGVAAAASGAPVTYKVEGSEPGETMTINSRVTQDDVKLDLPGPIMLTRYVFSCTTGSSEALVFEKTSKKPYAIFTHVAQVRFAPDLGTVVFYNYAKLTHHGGWTKMRAIFNIRRKRFAPLPVMTETSYLAAVGSKGIVTSSFPKISGARATVAVWNMGGKLTRALSVRLHVSDDGKRITDAMGLLPGDQRTFYHLARSGENAAVLRLQNLRKAHVRRAIQLSIPGGADEPVVEGKRVQLDLSGLTLKGGEVKYRVSASGKGDDWGAWQTAQ